MSGNPPDAAEAAGSESDALLDERDQAELHDFVQLLRNALNLREVYMDPRRGIGNGGLEDCE